VCEGDQCEHQTAEILVLDRRNKKADLYNGKFMKR
jgi:hypothetical protein